MAELRSQPTPRSKVMDRKQLMVLHHECYSSEKEANKRHSGRLIYQDQSGRIEASWVVIKPGMERNGMEPIGARVDFYIASFSF